MSFHNITFTCGRRDGLGARLIPILNCARLAETLGADFKFTWPVVDRHHFGPHHPDEIWSPHILKHHHSAHRESGVDIETLVTARSIWNGVSIRRVDLKQIGQSASVVVTISDPLAVYLVTDENPHSAREQLRSWFLNKAVSGQVKNAYERFNADHGRVHAGAHIRMGDVANTVSHRFRYFGMKWLPPNFFDPFFQSYSSPLNKVLLSTNSTNVQEELCRRYNCIYVPPLSQLSSLQQAAVEMLALANCEILTGATGSAFFVASLLLGNGSYVHPLASAKPEVVAEEMRRYLEIELIEARNKPCNSLHQDEVTPDLRILACKSFDPDVLSAAQKRLIARFASARESYPLDIFFRLVGELAMQLKPLESATLADTLEEEGLLNLTLRVLSLGPNPNSQDILLRRARLLVRMGSRGRAVWLVRQTTKGRLSPDAERLLLQQLNPSRAHHKLAKRVIDSDSEPLVN